MKNKKGYTIVEVLVSFILIMIVMIYLLRTVIVLTNKNNDLLVYEEYTVYENSLLKDIYEDVDIAYESDDFKGLQVDGQVVTFKDVNKQLKIDETNNSVIYDGKVYELPEGVSFRKKDNKIMDVTDLNRSTHEYYIITINTQVNKNEEEIKILYQNKKESELQIIYDPNGGTITSGEATQEARYGDKLKLPTASRDDYIFDGWYTKITGGNQVTNDTVIKEPAIYYAHWMPIYNITYTLAHGYVGSKCANENGTCTFTGKKQVCYGANGYYNCITATNSASCNNTTFGDPASGKVKACYLSSNPVTYTQKDEFTLNNPANSTAYIFKGWSGTDLSGDSNKTVKISKGSTGNRSYTANWTCASGYELANGRCRKPMTRVCSSTLLAYNGLCYEKKGTTSTTTQSCSSGYTKETGSGTYCCSGSNCYTKGVCSGSYTSKTVSGPYCWKYRGDSSAYYHCDSGYAKWDSSGNTCWKCTQHMYSGWKTTSTWSGPDPEVYDINSAWYCGTWYNSSGTTSYCPSGYRPSGSSCCITYTMKTAGWCDQQGGTFSQTSQTTRNGTGNCTKCTSKSSTYSGSWYYVEGGWVRGTERWEWTYTSVTSTTTYSCASGYTKIDNSTCRKNSGGTSPTVCNGDTINSKCYEKE